MDASSAPGCPTRRGRRRLIHTPWRMSGMEQARCGVHIGRDYPMPLVDHAVAAREARRRLSGARRAPDARARSQAIHARHGSRKGTRRRWHDNLTQRDMFDDGAP